MINELSVVIPTLNEEHYVPKLLSSLLGQNYKGKLQVIVVDGGSKDKTIKKVEKFKDTFDLLVFKTKKGQGYQRNRGAEQAKYPHLLFLDADILLPKNTLNRYLKNVNPNRRIVGRILFFPTKSNPFDFVLFSAAYIYIAIHSFFYPITSGGFLLTTKKNHENIGGFKEGGLLGEDIDYGNRSIADGAKFYMNYKTYVLHSSRRARKMGRFKMLWVYIVTYLYFRRFGMVPNTSTFYYPYGEYEGYY